MKSIFSLLEVSKGNSFKKEFIPKEIKNCKKKLVWDKPQLLNIQNKRITFRIFNNLIQGSCYIKSHRATKSPP